MANVVDILVRANTSQATSGMKSFTKELDNVVRGLTGFSLSGLGVTAAVVGIGNEVKKAVTEFNKYALAMGDAAQLSGVTAEEMSRLVQAADDVRVSQQSLTSAFGIALKNGFVPTIENVAKLSDELLAMEDPAARAEKASQIFGRGWKDIQRFLLLGGDAIRANTAAIEDGLVVTDAAVAQNVKLAREIDNLNDSYTAVKNTLVSGVIPGLSSSLEIFNRNIIALQEGVPLWDILVQNQKDYAAAEAIAGRQAEISNTAYSDVGASIANMATQSQLLTSALDGLETAQYGVNDVMKKYNEQLLFTIASEGLSAEAALSLATQMGLVDSATLSAYENTAKWKAQLDAGTITIDQYNANVLRLRDLLASLQDRTITVTVNTVGNVGLAAGALPSGYTDYLPGKAEGGAVYPGKSYIVGENGPEVLNMGGRGGNITPNGGAPTINIYATINNGMDVAKLGQQLASTMQRRR